MLDRLAAAGFALSAVTVDDCGAQLARRSDFRLAWAATRLHTFVFMFDEPVEDPTEAARLTEAARRYAVRHKGGLPRGFQTGSAAISVFRSNAVDAALAEWAQQPAKKRFASFALQAVHDLGTGKWFQPGSTKVWGAVYRGHLRQVLDLVKGRG